MPSNAAHAGVLAGVHGAGLTHGFFMQPGQAAVLQLLGDSFAQVRAGGARVCKRLCRGPHACAGWRSWPRLGQAEEPTRLRS